ncbi:MAG: UDP-N-acetylmuramate--L-alanine ligase, partial [Gemmatimonadales bacterium]
SRTRDFASEFGRALAGADAVFLTELYPAREQAIPGISSDLVDHATRVAGGLLLWRGERAALATALAGEVRSGDVVITVGAGDITRTARELRDILTQSARNR